MITWIIASTAYLQPACSDVKTSYANQHCCGNATQTFDFAQFAHSVPGTMNSMLRQMAIPASLYAYPYDIENACASGLLGNDPYDLRLTNMGMALWAQNAPVSYANAGYPQASAVIPIADTPFSGFAVNTLNAFAAFLPAPYTNTQFVELTNGQSVVQFPVYEKAPSLTPTALSTTPRRLTFDDFVVQSAMTFNGENVDGVVQRHNELDVQADFRGRRVTSFGSITTKEAFKNYKLEFDFRFLDENPCENAHNFLIMFDFGQVCAPNSGFLLHGNQDPNDVTDLMNQNFFEIQGAADNVGGNIMMQAGGVYNGLQLDATQFHDPLHVQIWTVGPNVKIYVDHNSTTMVRTDLVVEFDPMNGQPVLDENSNMIMKNNGEGHFGFQLEWGSFAVENIYIQGIDAVPS